MAVKSNSLGLCICKIIDMPLSPFRVAETSGMNPSRVFLGGVPWHYWMSDKLVANRKTASYLSALLEPAWSYIDAPGGNISAISGMEVGTIGSPLNCSMGDTLSQVMTHSKSGNVHITMLTLA